MTRQQAKELLLIITAYAEGKDIQQRIYECDQWSVHESPNFTLPVNCYRIKPKPREWWLVLDGKRPHGLFDRIENAMGYLRPGFVTIHVREVLDDAPGGVGK